MESKFSKSCDQTPLTNMDNHVESIHETTASITDASTDGSAIDSKELVVIPSINVEALAMVPMSQKTKRSDLSQRRTRRPFSILEVEALVEAVEKLGTGRLFNHGIGIHLLEVKDVITEKGQKINPKDNHISFQCSNMDLIIRQLVAMDIEYATAVVTERGIVVDQLFFHDPDGYMIEICNCQNLPVLPLSGLSSCSKRRQL